MSLQKELGYRQFQKRSAIETDRWSPGVRIGPLRVTVTRLVHHYQAHNDSRVVWQIHLVRDRSKP